MPTVAANAVSAAVSVAGSFGVQCAEPQVLADGANVIVHLGPAPLVAKVAASTSEVRDAGSWLQRELDLASFLLGEGAPVVPPSPEIPAVIHRAGSQVMSFWRYLPAAGDSLADEATIGTMLRELHQVLRRYQGTMPPLAPLVDIPAFLARPQSQLAESDKELLADVLARLTVELSGIPFARQVLHGDAGAGNLMATEGGWVWHDFEDCCSGPLAWDLAATTASPYLDRTRILAAYGDAPDAGQLRICEQLRRLHLTIWYALYAERLPGCRTRAEDLITSWRP